MSRRRSSSTSPGDDDPTPPRGNRSVEAQRRRHADDESWEADEWDDDWDEPNFLVRRAIVVGAVVLAIALLAVLASRLIGGDDTGGGSPTANAQWDTTVVLEADQIRLLDRDSGDEIDAYSSTIDLLDAQSLVIGDVLVTMTDDGAIGLVDLNDGAIRRGRSGVDETLLASPDNPLVAFSGPDAGGDVTIIDTAGRNVFSVADTAGLASPLIFTDDIRVNPAGTHVAVPVPNAFQSFVIDVAEETSDAFAGRVIAISDELVVTEQPAGPESEIEFHELGGERLESVDVPAPSASMLTDDGTLLLVADDGSVRSVASDGTIDDADSITGDDGTALSVTGGFPARDGTRLVVFTDELVLVLDEDGSVIGSAPGEIGGTRTRSMRCVLVASGSSADPSILLDLDDGSPAATIERGVSSSESVDGCTVALIGGADNLVTGGEVVAIDARSIAEVAPDGSAVAVLDGRDTELVVLDERDDPIEIADEPVVVRFGRRG